MRLAAILGLFGATAVLAQESLTAQQVMEQNDRNGDGVITREEARAAGTELAQSFGQIDRNRDDKITIDELMAVLPRR